MKTIQLNITADHIALAESLRVNARGIRSHRAITCEVAQALRSIGFGSPFVTYRYWKTSCREDLSIPLTPDAARFVEQADFGRAEPATIEFVVP